MSTIRRIGLLGGSFDPPHLAHLALGRVARETLALDELRWLPAGSPWQKQHRGMATGAHRAAMLEALLKSEPGCVIDTRELQRTGHTYTLDTVRELQAERPDPQLQWFLIIGQDQYSRFDTWHGWPEIVSRVSLAVAGRDGQSAEPPTALANHPHHCVVLPMPRTDISASEIRDRCAQGRSVAALVGPAVASYIARHRIYTTHANRG